MDHGVKVTKFLPNKLYGFVQGAEGVEVFFHQASFNPGKWPEVGPLVGEPVTVIVGARGSVKVARVQEPLSCSGLVESFNSKEGWGFIASPQGNFFLHQCEVADGHIPVVGQRVRFYSGFKAGRPRACYVRSE